MWTCVERRESEPFGKMLRNVIFTDLYENEGEEDLIFGLFKNDSFKNLDGKVKN